jgi:hypothetical protein
MMLMCAEAVIDLQKIGKCSANIKLSILQYSIMVVRLRDGMGVLVKHQTKKNHSMSGFFSSESGVPTGIRTPVLTVKG